MHCSADKRILISLDQPAEARVRRRVVHRHGLQERGNEVTFYTWPVSKF